VGLGVTGGIAAYKACEIVRGLDRAGAEVQVVLTRNALHFVTALSLETLSRRKVLLDTFDSPFDPIQHIDLTRGIDAFLVAPATANALAKFAHGIADDLLSTTYLAVTAPVVLAPAMNPRMWLHPATQANVATLKGRGHVVIDPEHGWLAEGETGWGRLADPGAIVAVTLAAARRSAQLAGKTVVVSAGPTREAIDPVRFVSNRSSGKQGYALAAALLRRGARVILVSGPVEIAAPFGVELVRVETAAEMRAAVHAARAGADALFMVAAVADYVPAKAAAKHKRTGGPLVVAMDEGRDILAEAAADRGGTILVGFAAETENLIENARAKLTRKGLDFVVANDVSGPLLGIGSERNAVTILDRDGGFTEFGPAGKAEVAEAILDRIFGPVR